MTTEAKKIEWAAFRNESRSKLAQPEYREFMYRDNLVRLMRTHDMSLRRRQQIHKDAGEEFTKVVGATIHNYLRTEKGAELFASVDDAIAWATDDETPVGLAMEMYQFASGVLEGDETADPLSDGPKTNETNS